MDEPMSLKVKNKVNGKFHHLGFEECYLMPFYNHIVIMHAPRGTLTLTLKNCK